VAAGALIFACFELQESHKAALVREELLHMGIAEEPLTKCLESFGVRWPIPVEHNFPAVHTLKRHGSPRSIIIHQDEVTPVCSLE